MTTKELTLVPPGRFAALLSNARRANGLDVVQLAAQSGGHYDARFLDEVERGRVVLTDPEVQNLALLYGVNTADPIVPERSQLIVDLNQGKMSIGQTGVSVGTGNGEVDQILERYLSLLYIMRGLKPGSDLTLRDRDLLVLSESLEHEIKSLESKLGQLMGSQGTKERTGLLGGRFALPAAGLLVALTAIGSLVIVGGGAVGADADAMPVNDGVQTTQVDQSSAVGPASDAGSGPARSLILPASFNGGGGESGGGGIGQDITVDSGVDDVVENSVDDGVEETAAVADSVEFVQSAGESVGAFTAAIGDGAGDDGGADDNVVVESAVTSNLAPISASVDQTSVDQSSVDQSTQWAQLGAEAEALVNFDWETALPGWTVEYVGDMPGYRGMTHTASNSIAIYINDGDTAHDVAEILAHEIGHALDVTYLDDAGRGAWLEARGMPMVWWAGSGMGDFEVGAGDFAEGFAAMTTGSASNSSYGAFTGAQLDLLRSLLP